MFKLLAILLCVHCLQVEALTSKFHNIELFNKKRIGN